MSGYELARTTGHLCAPSLSACSYYCSSWLAYPIPMCPFLQTTQEKRSDYDGLPTSIPIVGSLFAAPHHIAWSSGDAKEYMHIYNNPSASIQSTSLCPVHVYTKLRGWGGCPGERRTVLRPWSSASFDPHGTSITNQYMICTSDISVSCP